MRTIPESHSFRDGAQDVQRDSTRRVKPLRIAISPELRIHVGAAVDWAWRQLLTAAGYGWQEVSVADTCDIAYITEATPPPAARIVILASPQRWQSPATLHLAGLAADDPYSAIRYRDESLAPTPPAEQCGAVRLNRDILFDLFWLLTGQEERHWAQDTHGFYTLPESWRAHRVLEQAPASAIVERFSALLTGAGLGEPLPRWPHGRRAAAVITHDVDYPEVIRWIEPFRIVRRQGMAGIGAAWEVLTGRRDHWAFPRWMEFEARYGVRSAFYFVARQGSLLEYARGLPDPFYDVTTPRFRELFRTLIDGGWEVGMHASYRAYMAQEQFAAEKQRLEQTANVAVVGNRHHYWHMNPENPDETLQLHADIGLIYDTSLTHDRYPGWRRGSTLPFYPFALHSASEIACLQLPVAWMDAQLSQRTDLTQPQREAAVVDLVERVAAQRGLFVANVHDYVFDETLFPGWLATLRAALDRITARGDFWTATPAEIAAHWRQRYQQTLASSHGLGEGR